MTADHARKLSNKYKDPQTFAAVLNLIRSAIALGMYNAIVETTKGEVMKKRLVKLGYNVYIEGKLLHIEWN